MDISGHTADEVAIRDLIENWANSVRSKDYPGILNHHSADIVMFDVPPPFESKGIGAYRKTWDLFYSAQPEPVSFDIQHLEIVASADVAFAMALMQCAETGKGGERLKLDFRLTIGLRKMDDQWIVMHEHHSIPAT